MQGGISPQKALIAGVGVVGAPSSMSYRYVQDTAKNVLYVADNVPIDSFDETINVHPVPFRKFCDLNSQAVPSIGLSRPRTEVHRTLKEYEDIYRQQRGEMMVEPWRVDVARHRVPKQQEAWSCGANSGARFAAMLGSPVIHYHEYMNGMPCYGGGGLPRIGGNPEALQNHLRNASELAGTEIRQVCHRTFQPIGDSFRESLQLKRPALALTMNTETSMHWITIIGHVNGNFWYLDTNGEIYEMPAGDDDLHHWMNMGNCWAQRLGFVERYNCVVATGRHTPREK